MAHFEAEVKVSSFSSDSNFKANKTAENVVFMHQHASALWPGSVNLDMQPEDMGPTVVLTEHTSVDFCQERFLLDSASPQDQHVQVVYA